MNRVVTYKATNCEFLDSGFLYCKKEKTLYQSVILLGK